MVTIKGGLPPKLLPLALMSLTMHAVPMHVLLLGPLPEPGLYWKVMLVMAWPTRSSAPSALAVKFWTPTPELV